MSVHASRWEALQERHFVGETLSAEEESLRLSAAPGPAQAELDVLAAWSQALDAAAPASPEQVALVLEARGARSPHLRLVISDEELVLAAAGRRKRGALAFGGVAVAAAAAAVLSIHPFGSTPTAPVSRASSPVAAVLPARAELVFLSGQVLRGGQAAELGGKTLLQSERIETREGRACARVDPGVDVCLAPHTLLELSSLLEQRVELRVHEGFAVAALTPRASGHGFALASGDVVARARGTVFAVTAHAGQTSVSVAEGSVAVELPTGSVQVVSAHMSLVKSAAGAASLSSLGRADEGNIFGLLAPRSSWQSRELAALYIPGALGFSEAALDEGAAVALPLSSFLAVGKHRVSLRSAGTPPALVELEVRAGEKRTLELSDLPQGTPEREALPSPQSLLKAARHELDVGNRAAALQLYGRLRSGYPGSSEATTVLVTMGRLELGQGSAARALKYFDAYLQAAGPLSPEALTGRIEALRALGRTADERAAIERYLARYPKGFDASKLRQRLEQLAR